MRLIRPLVLLAALGFALGVQGATYSVDNANPAASDANPGTEAQPWRTIQKAANTAVAGDTCLVKAGTYPERVTVNRSGSATGRVVLKAAGPRTVATNGFVINGAYVHLEGFRVGRTQLGYAGAIAIGGAYAEI